ncbi:hypothetical protein EDC44_101211 [Cricetibacter osteomyelitidis]|uniref:TIGR01777 family protein n=2 Tax=Cricetibacter osteomyelitidis TaxID=1521931 RepID=A0A4V2T2L7_9PAST|nr:hypothetical protein EDC44_101211 [Cricetibacter osteomyelitidis]
MVGRALTARLLKNADKITAFSRSIDKAKQILSSQVDVVTHLDMDFSQFDAVINLAGEPIFDHYWTETQKQKLWDSRINLTRTLAEKINQATQPPHIFISASAVGFYGDCGDNAVTESHPSGNSFTARLCVEWEKQALQANGRVCLIRTSNILSHSDGMLTKILPLYQWGLGGKLGSGTQFMSWIHLQDMVNGIIHLLHHPTAQGAFNFSAPNPVRNGKFNQILGKCLNRPHFLPIPAFALKLVFGERAYLLLDSVQAVPNKLSESGFIFEFEKLENALRHLLHK